MITQLQLWIIKQTVIATTLVCAVHSVWTNSTHRLSYINSIGHWKRLSHTSFIHWAIRDKGWSRKRRRTEDFLVFFAAYLPRAIASPYKTVVLCDILLWDVISELKRRLCTINSLRRSYPGIMYVVWRLPVRRWMCARIDIRKRFQLDVFLCAVRSWRDVIRSRFAIGRCKWLA